MKKYGLSGLNRVEFEKQRQATETNIKRVTFCTRPAKLIFRKNQCRTIESLS